MGSSFGIISQTGNNIQTEGLIAYWDAAYKKSYPGSGTTWYDLSGNNNNITMTNATWNSGGYWLFDGIEDYGIISSLSGFSNTTNVTVFCGFKPGFSAGSADNGGRGALFGFGAAAGTTNDVYHWGSSNSNAFGLNTWNSDSWGVDDVVTYDDENTIGTFQLKFGGSNTTGFNMFINGIEQTESQVKGSTLTRTRSTKFGIGCNGWHISNQTWTGRIYYMAIYNRATSSGNALQNYQAQKGRFGL